MSRYIDADVALKKVEMQGQEHPNAYPLTHYATLVLSEAPTADVAPVVSGWWIDVHQPNEWSKRECSNCKSIFPGIARQGTCFCPNCGAKMGGGVE